MRQPEPWTDGQPYHRSKGTIAGRYVATITPGLRHGYGFEICGAAAGKVWLGYDEPDWLVRRHGLDPAAQTAVAALTAALDGLAHAAVGP
jgi:hypothetical protein